MSAQAQTPMQRSEQVPTMLCFPYLTKQYLELPSICLLSMGGGPAMSTYDPWLLIWLQVRLSAAVLS